MGSKETSKVPAKKSISQTETIERKKCHVKRYDQFFLLFPALQSKDCLKNRLITFFFGNVEMA